jgi:hypothetical protein
MTFQVLNPQQMGCPLVHSSFHNFTSFCSHVCYTPSPCQCYCFYMIQKDDNLMIPHCWTAGMVHRGEAKHLEPTTEVGILWQQLLHWGAGTENTTSFQTVIIKVTLLYYGNNLQEIQVYGNIPGERGGYNAFSITDHIELNGTMMNWEGFGRKWPWPNRCSILAVAWSDWEKAYKTSIRTVSIPAEI